MDGFGYEPLPGRVVLDHDTFAALFYEIDYLDRMVARRGEPTRQRLMRSG